MMKMFKLELLILSLMGVQKLCSAIMFPSTKILDINDNYMEYEKRMNLHGVPCLGDSYDGAYKTKMNREGKNRISPEEYKVFIDSFPRIQESLASFSDRSLKLMGDNSQIEGIQLYRNEEWSKLIHAIYPRVFEYYEDYRTRIRGDRYEALSRSMFKGLKYLFPNIGELYYEYKSRMETLSLPEFTEDEFNSFIETIPKIGETPQEYTDRIANDGIQNFQARKINRWIHIPSGAFDGLKKFYPLMSETYDTYKKRMSYLDINPISMESFEQFKLIRKMFKII